VGEVSTFEELYSAAKAEMQSRNPGLVDFREGSVNDAVAGAGALLAEEVIRVVLDRFSELFFATAEGAALDALLLDRLNETRHPATAAIGTVQWTRDVAGAYTIPLGTTFTRTVGGETLTFLSTSAVEMGVADTVVNVPVEASALGRASNVPSGVIAITDTAAEDPGATAAHAQPMAGGAPQETDDQVRERVKNLYTSQRRGTVPALKTGATSVPGVSFATVVEDFDNGVVYIYVGDVDAMGNDALAALVDAEIVNWRSAGQRVVVLGAAPEVVPLVLEIIVKAGTDQAQASADIKDSVVAYGASLGPGGASYASQVERACHDASDSVVSARQSTPPTQSTAAVLAQNAVRFDGASITINFTAET